MGKLTIEFTLPEEKIECDLAINGYKYFNALFDFSELLRREIKYPTSKFTGTLLEKEEYSNMLVHLLSEFQGILDNLEISLEGK
jgi:hypothetical protein